MDDATILRLTEVLSADVSGTLFREASAAAPNIANLIHALGCAHAARVAVKVTRTSCETDEQRAEFARLLGLTLARADSSVQLAITAQGGTVADV